MGFKKLGAEAILFFMTSGLAWAVWITAQSFKAEAGLEKVISIETKVDKIYDYLIDKKDN